MIIYLCNILPSIIDMSISTLQTIDRRPKKFKLSNILIYITAILIALLLVFFGKSMYMYLKGLGGKSAISVDIAHGRAEVFINDENIGVTPADSEEIKPGTNKVTLKSSSRQYETTINFLSNSDKYIHKVGIFRDLGVSDLFSSGQDLWFDESTSEVVLRIISEPPGASVYIDNTEIGKTPYTSSKLTEGDYDLRVENVNFEPQKARIRIQKGYTSNVAVKLFPMPVPSTINLYKGSDNLYDISSDNNQIVADTQTWTKAVIYWNQTRGVNLEGVGLNKELVFDYYLDYKGDIYNARGDLVTEPEAFDELRSAEKGAYLGRFSDGEGLTEMAREALKSFKSLPSMGNGEPKVRILPTGLSWLRVRSEPSTGSSEIAKVDVGQEYVLVEDGVEWVKIKVTETVQGWVSKRYVEDVVVKVEEVLPTATETTETPEEIPEEGTVEPEPVEEETPAT